MEFIEPIIIDLCLGVLLIVFIVLWLYERQKRLISQAELALYQKESHLRLESKEDLKSMFQSLSLEALDKNNRIFLDLAQSNLNKVQESLSHQFTLKEKAVETLVHPIRESLTQMDTTLKGLEKERVGSYEALKSQVGQLLNAQHQLCHETSTLSKALRSPNIRGRWGEIQLRRLVEMSGLSAHCDFCEQVSLTSSEGRFRPDMIVSLPQGKRLVLDAKAPLSHYLEALDTQEDTMRSDLMKRHAQGIRNHVVNLSGKNYWQQCGDDAVPEFVVLFLPGEPFFSSALEVDPQLIEWSLEKRVILATPATLIALLHAIAYGWRQEKLSEQILELSHVGRELAKRLSDVLGHVSKVGSDLEGVVKSYNRMVGSFETRLMPGARRFRDLSGHPDALPVLESIDLIAKSPRVLADCDAA